MSKFIDRLPVNELTLGQLSKELLLLSGKRVLIFDETPLIAVDIQQIVEDLGASAAVVWRRQDAAAGHSVLSELFDLAIFDDKSVRALEQDLVNILAGLGASIIVLTTDPAAERPPIAEQSRFAIVSKPYTYDTLVEAIGSVNR